MNERGFSKFYWGFLFIMVSIRLQGIDILPNAIGYIFFASGFSTLAPNSPHFEKAGKFNIPMIFLSLLSIYEPPVQGKGINFGPLGPIGILLGIISLVLGLLVVYHLLMGVKDMAQQQDQKDIVIEADKRWSQYLYLQIAIIFGFILIFVPLFAFVYFIGVIIASIILTVIMMGFMKRCGQTLQ